MKELTKDQKIYILKEMIRYYENFKSVRNECKCMCELMGGIITNDFKIDIKHTSDDIELLFPEFRNNNIPPTFKGKYSHWFKYGESKPRLKYCKKILKLIEK